MAVRRWRFALAPPKSFVMAEMRGRWGLLLLYSVERRIIRVALELGRVISKLEGGKKKEGSQSNY